MTTYRDYTDEEIERRGEAIYAHSIRPLVEKAHKGEYVAIDIETGAWEKGENVFELASRLHERHPQAALYTVRVGYPYAERLGGHLPGDQSP